MITLYVKNGCPYCLMTLSKVDELKLEVKLLDIADEGISEELIGKGGKRQVPYMIDSAKEVSMYESGDIVEHLEKYYGNESSSETSDDSKSDPDVESKSEETPKTCDV